MNVEIDFIIFFMMILSAYGLGLASGIVLEGRENNEERK